MSGQQHTQDNGLTYHATSAATIVGGDVLQEGTPRRAALGH